MSTSSSLPPARFGIIARNRFAGNEKIVMFVLGPNPKSVNSALAIPLVRDKSWLEYDHGQVVHISWPVGNEGVWKIEETPA